MADFTKEYFRMSESDVALYAHSRLDFFDMHAQLSCCEIGDGNLNYVFRVIDTVSGKSIIIKQAGPVARISDDFKLSPDRNRIESEILRLHQELAPSFVPEVYSYDPIMNCCAMEDLSDHQMMRLALIEHKKFPQFAEHISTFMANTLLLTSDVVLEHKAKKAMVKNYINPELCEISEDLVYTEPFYDCPRNIITPGMEGFIKENIWSDQALLLETAKTKHEFLTNAQSLIHGDLHTGSIFIKEGSTKVFDPEFAFYGPAGYDVGNIVANLIFAWANGKATILDPTQRGDFCAYLMETIQEVVDLFSKKFLKLWKEQARTRVEGCPGFKEYYLGTVLRDTSAVAGHELMRRIIGLAPVKDITIIEEEKPRLWAEKTCLTAAKMFIMERERIKTGDDFVKVVLAAEKQIGDFR